MLDPAPPNDLTPYFGPWSNWNIATCEGHSLK